MTLVLLNHSFQASWGSRKEDWEKKKGKGTGAEGRKTEGKEGE